MQLEPDEVFGLRACGVTFSDSNAAGNFIALATVSSAACRTAMTIVMDSTTSGACGLHEVRSMQEESGHLDIEVCSVELLTRPLPKRAHITIALAVGSAL